MTMTAYDPIEVDDTDAFQAIYQHTLRPEWGVAILAWERGDKRGYQFDDGTLRIFKRDYFQLLEEVDPPEGIAGELFDELNRRLHESMEQRGRTAAPPKPLVAVYPFHDQLAIFKTLYPGGFQDPKWLVGLRGVGANKRLKRHRQAAVEQAGELFARDRMHGLIEADQHGEIWTNVMELLDATDLVGRAQLDTVRKPMARRVDILATTLFDVLHGVDAYGRRFTNFVRALRAASGRDPSWRLATVLPALFTPKKSVCVRPSTFRKQAGELAPRLVYDKRPRRKGYRNYRKVAKATQRRLVEEGLQPADFLDVHDFVWVTLRPAAAKHLER